jgi:hypothetical protein
VPPGLSRFSVQSKVSDTGLKARCIKGSYWLSTESYLEVAEQLNVQFGLGLFHIIPLLIGTVSLACIL